MPRRSLLRGHTPATRGRKGWYFGKQLRSLAPSSPSIPLKRLRHPPRPEACANFMSDRAVRISRTGLTRWVRCHPARACKARVQQLVRSEGALGPKPAPPWLSKSRVRSLAFESDGRLQERRMVRWPKSADTIHRTSPRVYSQLATSFRMETMRACLKTSEYGNSRTPLAVECRK